MLKKINKKWLLNFPQMQLSDFKIRNFLLIISAYAVHPNWKDHEEAHPRRAPGPEDHVRGSHPEVLGCRYRPCESDCLLNSVYFCQWTNGALIVYILLTANKEETGWCQQTSRGTLWQTQRAGGECPARLGLAWLKGTVCKSLGWRLIFKHNRQIKAPIP